MSYQYYHDRDQKYTVALKTIEKDSVLKLLQEMINDSCALLNVNIGIAELHPDDQYCRKTGREVAISKIVNTYYKVHRIYNDYSEGTKIIRLYPLTDEFPNNILELEIKDSRPSVYFLAYLR